jgi:hypothetical protein
MAQDFPASEAPSAAARRRARLSAVAPWGLVLGAFGVSRWLLWRQGVRFDMGPLPWFFQFLEPELLKERLLESVYYLHGQPPLFNLLVGGVLKAFPESAERALGLLYTGFGLLLAASLYGLLVRLRVPRWVGAGLTVGFLVSPPTVLYESWLFYTYPEALLLCASALLLHRYAASGRGAAGVAFFALVGALALTRSAFHLVWYVALVGLVLGAAPRVPRRQALLAAAGPLLLLLALYTKNALHFGSFAASSWFGMNFAQLALRQLPGEERQALVREGRATELALYNPFQPLSAYPAKYQAVRGPEVPALRREMKPSGWPNFNHVAYVGLSRAFGQESLAAVRARPGRYLENVWRGVRLFLTPASDYPFLATNRPHLRALERFYNRYVFGTYAARTPDMRGEWLAGEEVAERTAWGWTGLLLFGLGAAGVWALGERRRTGAFSAEGITLLFLAGNVLYVALVGNLFEYGENNRLRYPIDALVLAMGAAGVAGCVRAARARWGRRLSGAPGAPTPPP